jgi:hypothetical protein
MLFSTYDGNQNRHTRNLVDHVRFEVFTAVTMKNAVFWDVASCRSCVNRLFGGTYHPHLQGIKIRERGTNVSKWLQTEPPVGRIMEIGQQIVGPSRYMIGSGAGEEAGLPSEH